MSDWLVTATGLMLAIADGLWAARGLWALIVLALVWRLTLHTREIALYFQTRRLQSEQRRLLSLASSLADQFGDDPKGDVDLEKRLRRIQQRLRKLDRALGWSSLDRPSPP